ncbi:MAG: hypothetical protein LBD05_01200, partial [Mycoplasmataceae bacterium]|nr:hypothetical protein [Mycoplasmataceae bacterium]
KIINNILPEIKGKILIEKYFLYSCDKKIINAYEEILKLVFNDKKVDKSIIRFTTNALSQIGSEDINNTTIVNINANDTIFYKYDNNKNLTNIDTFIGGYKEIENKIINFFEEKIKITDCSFLNKLSKINNLIKKTDFALLKNIPLVNVFSNSNFLSYSEINCEILFLLLRELNTNFFIKLFEQKKDVSKKIITLFDESIKYFTYANDNELFRLNNATFFEEEAVVGLEGNIVCNLLKACDFVEKENKSKDVKEYSIIPYVNQKVANKHIKNNFFTSIGILTTAWAAKIGGE